MVREHLPDILVFLLKCETAYITFKLQKKAEPEDVKKQQLKVRSLIKDLSLLTENPDLDFFDVSLVKIMDTNFGEIIQIYTDYLEAEKLKPKKTEITEVIEEEEVEPVIKDDDEKEEVLVYVEKDENEIKVPVIKNNENKEEEPVIEEIKPEDSQLVAVNDQETNHVEESEY